MNLWMFAKDMFYYSWFPFPFVFLSGCRFIYTFLHDLYVYLQIAHYISSLFSVASYCFRIVKTDTIPAIACLLTQQHYSPIYEW